MRTYALSFARGFIKVTGFDDDIIPKKGRWETRARRSCPPWPPPCVTAHPLSLRILSRRFSPFEFFCAVFPACVKSSDGGGSAHGITQVAIGRA